MNKTLQIISWITIALALGVIGLISYWMIYPYVPITFDEPHKVITKEVFRGEHLVYEVNYCKKSNVVPLITKTFVDGVIYAVPEIVATDKSLGCGTQTVQMYIPKALPAGVFFIKTIYKYQVNPIRSITVVSRTEKFLIK